MSTVLLKQMILVIFKPTSVHMLNALYEGHKKGSVILTLECDTAIMKFQAVK